MALHPLHSSSFSPSLTPSTSASSVSPESPDALATSPATIDVVFHCCGIRLALPIDAAYVTLLQSLKDAFLSSLSARPGIADDIQSPVELALAYLDFIQVEQTGFPALFAALSAFNRAFLLERTIDIHSRWLRIYYRANHIIHAAGSYNSRSAFFDHVKRNLFQPMAVFGGQGDVNHTCPILKDLLAAIGPLLFELSGLPWCSRYYHGRAIDLKLWLDAPVSVPIIGVLSLARYTAVCYVLGLKPGELRDMFRGTTGHSQGLLVSIVVAMSDSWSSFYANCRLISHHGAPRSCVSAIPSSNDVDPPSYMLTVKGIKQSTIGAILNQIHLALVNARDQYVVAGPVASLSHLRNQSRIPSSNRKPSIHHGFLPISAPFHTPYLAKAVNSVKQHLDGKYILPEELHIAVYHTRTGQDLRSNVGNILHVALNAIAQELCDWPAALAGSPGTHGSLFCSPQISHIIAFDRGGLGPLVKRIKDGYGIRVIQGADFDSRDPEIGTMRDLFSPRLLDTSIKLQSWAQRFQPRLTTGGVTGLNTRLSRLLGTPPIMVAGMTPTTVHWDFVSAIMNSGYHVELAGGGYRSAADFSAAVHLLAKNIPPGRGITCNLIYANPRAIRWQISALRRLSQEQVPIDGLTIGAGIPSSDIVAEYIGTLGIRHIGFKPGSVQSIHQVVQIAKFHPNFPIILQWTGGRGGGHHSYEDFHTPILNTYGLIRQCSNIYLVAGSGFGDGDSVYPYISGCWSTSYGHAPMPFDGVLLGSRMMVAREAHTSPAVKAIITKTLGVPDQVWEKTYTCPAGGVITVRSEMGEPIHKVATRGVLLWAELDKTVFKLPAKDRVTYLRQHRQRIINRLNADFAKPWFGRNSSGDVVSLEEMSYLEVLTRCIDLMYIAGQNRWIDESYADFVFRFATRTLGRLRNNIDQNDSLTHETLTRDPCSFTNGFSRACPDAAEEVLNPEDCSFFLMECKRPGQKPVNFVPALNEDFELYFKKDSLWQSEDIDAVVGQDAERVCILHGPVAAQYSQVQDESAKEILDSLVESLVDRIQQNMSDDGSLGLNSGPITPDSWSTVSAVGKEIPIDVANTSSTSFTINNEYLASTGSLNQCRGMSPWVQALLGDRMILQNGTRSMNPFRQLLDSNQATIQTDPDHPEIVEIAIGTSESMSSMRASCHNGVDIAVELTYPMNPHPLQLLYQFDPGRVPISLNEVMDCRNERIKSFYSKIWFDSKLSCMSMRDTFHGTEMILTRELLEAYIEAVGPAFHDYRLIFPESENLPISIGIIVVWDVISRPLVLNEIDGDLLRLVHRSNSFEYYPGAAPLRIGDTVNSSATVQAVYVEDTGKTVVVEAQITRSEYPVMKVTSTFFFRGTFNSMKNTFRRTKESWVLQLPSQLDEAILLDRVWFKSQNNLPPLTGKTIRFEVESQVTYKKDGGYGSLHVTGNAVSQLRGYQWEQVGLIDFQSDDCVGNPVLDYFQRKGLSTSNTVEFKTPGWSGPSSLDIQMPATNQTYADVSKDCNPIHVSTMFATLAELPGTLCHGMCTSAVTASCLEHLVLGRDWTRLRRFSATFTSMVMPLEKLVVELEHTGMVEGRMRFGVNARRKENGETVLEAEAEVEQPATAYLFTGQGSQSKGMGLDLYESSSVVKALWDDIDAHIFETYGWSILHIIRNNPRTLTIHFGGRQGRKIKQNYLDITTEVVLPNGVRTKKPVLVDINAESTSYTFSDSRGLLYSTQFAQPAILLFEAATFAEMRNQGYVSQGAMYAGHSLGEYGALAALSPYVPTKALVELAFYRGLMMQAAVAPEQESAGYGMVAANPKRVGKFRIIASESQELLEIVNYNLEGEQYVCAGTTTNLYVLGKLIDHIAQAPDGAQQVQEALHATDATSELHRLTRDLIGQVRSLALPITLERGKATIPLQGIDVPFHSSHLRSTVDRFRQCLRKPGLFEGNVDFEALEGRYIPNLVAKPFSLDEEYIREVFELTGSPILAEILGLDNSG
ncbi:beta subunit of fatty acid synthase [Aspergillus taichungensis]|uniref:Beta subunit of fatty acid synthase n=1 Tax=Aspergillus taichungensis TaxID=482145 RepID=A0A2J5I6N6_9EURO|nr:beta subunit of fatty acid synthase [Aspergillus taichungensis]